MFVVLFFSCSVVLKHSIQNDFQFTENTENTENTANLRFSVSLSLSNTENLRFSVSISLSNTENLRFSVSISLKNEYYQIRLRHGKPTVFRQPFP
jgi:hypothetical protein